MLAVLVAASGAGCVSSQKETAAKAPSWQRSPGQPTYYINSVAVSGDGGRVVGGTFFHAYGASSRSAEFLAKTTAASSQGTYGTYCYNADGSLLWKDEFNGYEGVYWTDISTDGAYAASGGWFSGSPNYAGFVRAYDVGNQGAKLLDYATTSRVNQVALTADGGWLVSAAETLVLFKRVDGTFRKTGEYTPAGSEPTVVTAAISADGNWIVAADYSGNILLLANKGGLPVVWKQWKLPSGSSHCVRITPDGSAFVAGGSQGNFYFFDRMAFIASGQPTVTAQMSSQAAVYGVAVADDASAFVGVSNLTAGSTEGGLVYFVKTAGGGAPAWTFQTARNPNCASLNIAKGLLAVADGHPDGSPGNFYLFNTADGSLRWSYGTSNMSWPVMISADGNAVVAGSDDSNIYYFTP